MCQTCVSGFNLANNLCVAPCPFPCATCDANNNCLTCFAAYSLSGTSCQPDIACSSTSSCTACPLSYAITAGTCVHCTAANCLQCLASTVSSCELCVDTHYVNSGSCSPCISPCLRCQTSSVCLTCIDGYYMTMMNGQPSGKCQACSTTSNCLTCRDSATLCTSCITGYDLVSTSCQSVVSVSFSMTFASTSATSAS